MKRILMLFFMQIVFACMVFTQPKPIPIDTLSFAHFQDNIIYFDTTHSLLISFFEKFDSVLANGNGNIDIVHIGGSHVQAGTFPHRVRVNLLQAFPEMTARRGMIFPYSAAKKCNNPIDYRITKQGEFNLVRNVYNLIERPLGVTGIAIYPTDTIAEIKISLTSGGHRFETERIHVLGYSDKGRIVPVIRIDTSYYEPIMIEPGWRRFTYEVDAFSDSLTLLIPSNTDDVFTLTGVFLDNDKPGITYHSIGVNGASVPSFLKCEYFVEDLQLLEPDMVIFGLGINDASGTRFDTTEFVRNYMMLIDKIKEVNPECVFVFITNNDSYQRVSRGKYVVNKRGPIVQRQFYKLASLTQGAVWDQFHIMGGLKSMDKWRIEKLAQNDRVHFTNKGYNLLGDLFFNAFLDAREKCSLLNALEKESGL